ncbi:MAG: type I-G CRISPR-associated helicase/endonuclease Cas3g [Acidimicrobiales bacterium]
MTPLGVDDFAACFEAVHGTTPFDWQAALARRVLDGEGWPEGIDVPTGLGKTAVIDAAVFALAAEVEAGRPRTAPTRTFVVVDRRVIVDQAFQRASLIADALTVAPAGTVLHRVAAALRSLSAGGPPLVACRMRGGLSWSWRWLAQPSQPAVVVATVDQFGSRLLFRGYGVGKNLRPIDAALCGTDALVVLDEAHLSQPLVETARSVAAHEARAEVAVVRERRAGPVLISATLPAATAAWRPDLDAERSGVARRRIDVVRTARLVELVTRKDAVPDLASAMAALAGEAIGREGVDRVGVVCNTVRLAREVFRSLQAAKPPAGLALLIGRCRQAERDRVAAEVLPRLAATEERPPAGPVIAVATQTIEVGADLDVDFLVTEAAPLDALLQRLGRLNRFGRPLAAEAVVAHAAARHDADPVYGPATSRTWDWLLAQAGTPRPTRHGGVAAAAAEAPTVDLGPRSIATLATPEERRNLATEAALAPVVLGPVLDAWARTSPVLEPDQPVAPYLHGLARPSPEVLVCWRGGLPTDDHGAWREDLRTAPVGAGETVSVPIWEAARFLAGQQVPSEVSDLEGAYDLDLDLDERERVPAVVVRADGEVVPVREKRDLRPGDTVVVPSERGGHDEWGWTGVSGGAAVPDVADLGPRRRPRLRLRAAVLGTEPDGIAVDLRDLVARLGEDPEGDDERVDRVLAAVVERTGGPYHDRLRLLAGGLRGAPSRRLSSVHGAWVVVEGPAASGPPGPASLLGEDLGDADELSSSASSRRVTLEQHLVDVGDRALGQAVRLGLPGPLARAVELAGRAHDLGKADPRFQAMLHEGQALRALAAPEPLAKSGMNPLDSAAFGRARRLAGWPGGMRHESISAAMVSQLAAAVPGLFDAVDFELVLHLVQSHHGRARPLLPAVVDAAPGPVVARLPEGGPRVEVRSDRDLVDWEGPARFARLGRRYGWWGLALLEAVVRLADMDASESYRREEAAP